MGKFIDLTGRAFGEWTVLRRAGTAKGQTMWECQCSCGKMKTCSGGNLRAGLSSRCKSCAAIINKTTHGQSKTPLFVAWFGMIQRCENPKHKSFAEYGGRGICVCKRWHKFECFYADMGERPDKASLDRIDNSKGYCKSNCQWATHKKQMRNTRSNSFVTFRGETKTQSEWSEITGISQRIISDRLSHGWNVEAALTKPPKRNVSR